MFCRSDKNKYHFDGFTKIIQVTETFWSKSLGVTFWSKK